MISVVPSSDEDRVAVQVTFCVNDAEVPLSKPVMEALARVASPEVLIVYRELDPLMVRPVPLTVAACNAWIDVAPALTVRPAENVAVPELTKARLDVSVPEKEAVVADKLPEIDPPVVGRKKLSAYPFVITTEALSEKTVAWAVILPDAEMAAVESCPLIKTVELKVAPFVKLEVPLIANDVPERAVPEIAPELVSDNVDIPRGNVAPDPDRVPTDRKVLPVTMENVNDEGLVNHVTPPVATPIAF